MTRINGLFTKSDSVVVPAKVIPEQIISELAHQNASAVKKNTEIKILPDKQYAQKYARIADLIDGFVKTYAGNAESVDKENVIAFIAESANKYEAETIKESYLDGLTATVEKVFKNEAVIARVRKTTEELAKELLEHEVQQAVAKNETGTAVTIETGVKMPAPFKESPIAVSLEALQKYTDQFNSKLNAAATENARKEAENAVSKEASILRLYISAGAFMTFLLVVFVSILIKIERNLRVIAEKS